MKLQSTVTRNEKTRINEEREDGFFVLGSAFSQWSHKEIRDAHAGRLFTDRKEVSSLRRVYEYSSINNSQPMRDTL